MSRPWTRGRIAVLALGVICVAVGLYLIIPALVG